MNYNLECSHSATEFSFVICCSSVLITMVYFYMASDFISSYSFIKCILVAWSVDFKYHECTPWHRIFRPSQRTIFIAESKCSHLVCKINYYIRAYLLPLYYVAILYCIFNNRLTNAPVNCYYFRKLLLLNLLINLTNRCTSIFLHQLDWTNTYLINSVTFLSKILNIGIYRCILKAYISPFK